MERLRGINIGGWLSQIDAIKEKDPDNFPGIDAHMESFISEEDFLQVKEWGFNHVRIPIDFYLFFDENANPYKYRLQHLDRALRWAHNAELSMIIDLHECPGHDFAESDNIPIQKLFADPSYLKKTEKIWACLSERYSDHDHIYYEVLNEPVSPSAEIWNEIKDKLCKNIRRYASKVPIIVGSNLWNSPSTYSQMTPVDLDNMVYCFHFYEPLLFTHQFAPWIREPEIREKREYPADFGEGFVRKYGRASSGIWNRDRFVEEIAPVKKFGDKYGAPVICNEFGVYASVPMQFQLRWLEDLLSVCKEMDIGFSYWNYKNLDFGIISRGESLHSKLEQYNNPQRINYQVLSVLQKY
jgi:aryl-phospho-beta-D-glucosidase BglC (GH1 family)